ncbi:MAG: trehalase family glycosidase, partial [Bacteroidota bacterium]
MVNDIFLLGQLFEQVQMQNIFGDGKTFVDCTPRSTLSHIQTEFEKQKNETGFDLKTFVEQHFILPEAFTPTYIAAKEKPLVQHLHLLWNELTRQPEAGNHSLLPLPYSYIVPGGRFREIYYWDSFFTMLGLQVSGKIEVIENMVNNFSSCSMSSFELAF